MTSDIDDSIRDLERKLRAAKKERGDAGRKAALADPEVRARMSAATKAALADPEVRARMSAANKAAWILKDALYGAPKRPRKRATLESLPRIGSLGDALAMCGKEMAGE